MEEYIKNWTNKISELRESLKETSQTLLVLLDEYKNIQVPQHQLAGGATKTLTESVSDNINNSRAYLRDAEKLVEDATSELQFAIDLLSLE